MKKFRTASGEPPQLPRRGANLMQNMLEEVKASLTILPELKALIPPLQPGELEQLRTNILREGCREALLVWQTSRGTVEDSADSAPLNVLIDGHNRYAICQEHGVAFKLALREFDSLEQARAFMIDNQLGRRNLTPEQLSYLRGLKYRAERQASGRPTQEDSNAEQAGHAPTGTRRTRDKLAETFNVSPRTILRDKEYSQGLDRLTPELKQQVLRGSQKLPKEVVREIGRQSTDQDLATAPPLSLPQVLSLLQSAASPVSPPPEGESPAELIELITRQAAALDPASATFSADCDQLIVLLEKAKRSRA